MTRPELGIAGSATIASVSPAGGVASALTWMLTPEQNQMIQDKIVDSDPAERALLDDSKSSSAYFDELRERFAGAGESSPRPTGPTR